MSESAKYILCAAVSPKELANEQWQEKVQGDIASGKIPVVVVKNFDDMRTYAQTSGVQPWKHYALSKEGDIRHEIGIKPIVIAKQIAPDDARITFSKDEAHPEVIGVASPSIDMIDKGFIFVPASILQSEQMTTTEFAADLIHSIRENNSHVSAVLLNATLREDVNINTSPDSREMKLLRAFFGDNGKYNAPERDGHMHGFDVMQRNFLRSNVMTARMNFSDLEALTNAEQVHDDMYKKYIKQGYTEDFSKVSALLISIEKMKQYVEAQLQKAETNKSKSGIEKQTANLGTITEMQQTVKQIHDIMIEGTYHGRDMQTTLVLPSVSFVHKGNEPHYVVLSPDEINPEGIEWDAWPTTFKDVRNMLGGYYDMMAKINESLSRTPSDFLPLIDFSSPRTRDAFTFAFAENNVIRNYYLTRMSQPELGLNTFSNTVLRETVEFLAKHTSAYTIQTIGQQFIQDYYKALKSGTGDIRNDISRAINIACTSLSYRVIPERDKAVIETVLNGKEGLIDYLWDKRNNELYSLASGAFDIPEKFSAVFKATYLTEMNNHLKDANEPEKHNFRGVVLEMTLKGANQAAATARAQNDIQTALRYDIIRSYCSQELNKAMQWSSSKAQGEFKSMAFGAQANMVQDGEPFEFDDAGDHDVK